MHESDENSALRVFGMNGKMGNYVCIDTDMTHAEPTFLVDTEAHVSLIKISTLKSPFRYNRERRINIKGVTGHTMTTIGSIWLNLLFNGVTIEHEFQLVHDNFSIPTDGILGNDFIHGYGCKLHYDEMKISLVHNGVYVQFPFLSDRENIIPPRSEVYRVFRIKAKSFPCIIESQSTDNGVFIPNTIVQGPKQKIRVLNTTNESQTLKVRSIKTQPLRKFHVIKMHSAEGERKDRAEELEKVLKNNIPKHATAKCLALCKEYSDIFHLDGDKASVNSFYEQKLRVKDSDPVYVKNYRLPQTQKEEIKTQVRELLRNDLIEMSQSDYNSPLIIVPKKRGPDGKLKWRMCVDYRLVNKKLLLDRFPLPRIDEILDGLGNACYFSIMDLHSGYHQIPLEKESRKYTAFSTDDGFYQFKVVPFGLATAPAAFNRMMQLAFAGLKPAKAFIYMDDIIVIGANERDHLNNLRGVFEVCRKFNLKLNPTKCKFFAHEVTFLGHRCTSDGLLPDPSKLNAVKNYPRPTDDKSAKRFVAFANYYRRFVKNFAEYSRPLSNLTRKGVIFKWTDECERSFQHIKKALVSPPLLQYADYSKPFVVTVDASHKAMGCVLSQNVKGEDLPICYLSKAFKSSELSKDIVEKELLAVHFAITQLRPYLYGRHFTVRSDHKPLLFLYNLKNPASRLTRIRLTLEEYDFDMVHIKGSDNVVADALSRVSINDFKGDRNDSEEAQVLAITRSMARKQNQPDVSNKARSDIDEEKSMAGANQNECRIYEEMSAQILKKTPRVRTTDLQRKNNYITSVNLALYLRHRKLCEVVVHKPTKTNLTLSVILTELEKTTRQMEIYEVQWPKNDGIFDFCTLDQFKESGNKFLKNLRVMLITPPKVVETNEEKMHLIEKYHSDKLHGGHCGSKRLYAKLRAYFYWPSMVKDIAKFVKECEICRRSKPQHMTKQPMILTRTPIEPFDLVVIDTIGPLIPSHNGNKYVLTMNCDMSKWLVMAPMPNKSAKDIAKAIFDHFVAVHGPMREIKTDRGTEFDNQLMRELCELLGVKHCMSTAYHHETVGTSERNHRVFNEYLRAYLENNSGNWEDYLKSFSFNYNCSKNSTNGYNYSPFEIVYKKKPPELSEILTGNVDPVYNLENYVKESKYKMQITNKIVTEILNKGKIANKLQYDKKLNELDIQVGEFVRVKNEPYDKFKLIYSEALEVVGVDEPNVVLKRGDKLVTIHKNRVIKA